MQGGADLVDVDAVSADGLVESVAGDAELFGPVGDIGGQLGVDDLRVVRTFGVFFVQGVRGVFLGDVVVLGQCVFLVTACGQPKFIVRPTRFGGAGFAA